MDLAREEQQRTEFRSILFDLAELEFSLKDAASRSKMYQRLERLYHTPSGEEKYRHFYSDIFIVLTQIQQGDYPGSIDVLGQNLAAIRKGYQPKNVDEHGTKIDIQDSLKKLYDHVSLDIARINYSDAADRKVEQSDSIAQVKLEVAKAQNNIDNAKKALDTEVHSIHKLVEEAQYNIEEAKNSLDQEICNINKSVEQVQHDVNQAKSEMIADVQNVRDSVKDVQKEYIAILGIFASIVLAFTGGIAFSTSVLENMHTTSIYRIIIVTLFIGLVLINILFALFYYIGKLIHDSDNHRVKPLLISNIIILILIALTVLAWKDGYVEKRNKIISQETSIVATDSDSIQDSKNETNLMTSSDSTRDLP